jgi:DNA-binding SARP family transcriptional activator
MPRLAWYLLGPPRIERDGTPVHIRRRKAVALLAYLAVTGSSHSREKLATLFWPESDQSRALASLRVVLTALNNALGEGWLQVDRETVSLAPDLHAEPSDGRDLPMASEQEFWLDAAAFRSRLAAIRAHDHRPEEVCPACLSSLAAAVDLYRDDFLAGFTLPDSPAYDEWQFFQTEDLRQQLASVLEQLVRGHSARGAYESAIPYARRRVSLDALHEPAYRALMQLYAWSGQRAAALRQYAECERILREELGMAPEEETARIYRAIREKRETPPPVEAPVDRYDLLPSEPSPSAATSPAQPGVPAFDALLNGSYRLDAELGRGGMGGSPTNLPAQHTPFVGR